MDEVCLIKLPNGCLRPALETEAEKLSAYPVGQAINCKITKKRNYQFFKKWWSLVKFAYDNWEPPAYTWIDTQSISNQVPQKNFERMRRELTILAGHYDVVLNYKGMPMKQARSISFGAMSESEFSAFYSATIDAILSHFLDNYNKEELENVVQEIIGYT